MRLGGVALRRCAPSAQSSRAPPDPVPASHASFPQPHSDADRPQPAGRQPQQRPGGPPLGSACRTSSRHCPWLWSLWVPCIKKGDCWHQEVLLDGCSQSLLSEDLVQSRHQKETKMTTRDQVGNEPVSRPSLVTKFGKLLVTNRSRPFLEGWS